RLVLRRGRGVPGDAAEAAAAELRPLHQRRGAVLRARAGGDALRDQRVAAQRDRGGDALPLQADLALGEEADRPQLLLARGAVGDADAAPGQVVARRREQRVELLLGAAEELRWHPRILSGRRLGTRLRGGALRLLVRRLRGRRGSALALGHGVDVGDEAREVELARVLRLDDSGELVDVLVGGQLQVRVAREHLHHHVGDGELGRRGDPLRLRRGRDGAARGGGELLDVADERRLDVARRRGDDQDGTVHRV